MKGLEISEVKLSNISFENRVNRIDAEYFKKIYLKEDSLRSKFKTVYLGDQYFVTDGQHGYHEVDENSEIRHLTARNFKNWFANDKGADRLAKWVDDKNKRSSLKINDVVLTTRGTVGHCAIVRNEVLPANIDQDVARIAALDEATIKPQYLVAYLNSKFGKDWTFRNQTGMVQQGLALWRVKELPIPSFSTTIQNKISLVVDNAHETILKSKNLYAEAQELLLKEIGLQNFIPSTETINVKNLKDSFAISGRLDAEYYQLKYEQVIEKVKSNNYDKLSKLVDINKSIEPGSKNYEIDGLPFIRVADYSKYGLTKPQKYLKSTYVNDNKEKIEKLKPKKGTILFSKDGSVGTAFHLRHDIDAITSGAILHLKVKNSKEIIPEYLTLALNSKVVQMQAERDAGGSIILHWRLKEIEDVVVPIIDISKQKQIANLIEESFTLKKQSEHLLQIAKKAVEITIEENEKIATQYINNQSISNGKY